MQRAESFEITHEPDKGHSPVNTDPHANEQGAFRFAILVNVWRPCRQRNVFDRKSEERRYNPLVASPPCRLYPITWGNARDCF